MKSLLFLATLVVVNCYVDVKSEINGVYNYLNSTGVQEAERIRKLENELRAACLTSVNLRVISNAECRSTCGTVIQDHHLCTSGSGNVGIYIDDTGGPLVFPGSWRDTLIGVGSLTSSRGCLAGAPSGFIRVTSFIEWIIGN